MIRRVVDILVSATVLLVLSPLFLAIVIAIRLDSPGKAIYIAWRSGKAGRRFPMLKFRSMVADADQRGPAITSLGDSRITRVGRFLRATKLDEFPQFWNVLKGDMTLIGPRPEAPEIVECYTSDQKWVFWERPGLTGPSQIACSVDESMAVSVADRAEDYYFKHVLDRKLAMDAEYIRNRSVARDLALVGRTVRLILQAMLRRAA